MKGPIWCAVRQQAWTEELNIVSTSVLYFCDFLISSPSFQKRLISKHRYCQLDRKDQYLIWLQQTPLHFCHRLCLMKVACPRQSDKRNKGRKQKEEMRLNYIQEQQVIRSHELDGYRCHWAHEAAKGWEQQLREHPDRAEGQTTPRAWRQEKSQKSQIDAKKVTQAGLLHLHSSGTRRTELDR